MISKFFSWARPTLTLVLCVLATTAVTAQDQFIHLKEIDGHTWLISPKGKPFFAHGVTHISQKEYKDVRAIGTACMQLGFNSYGYGCPEELKSDMPYLEGRQLVPMSMYRTTDGSFNFVDIFDPEVQSNLENQIKQMCWANRDNKNLIGYCWTDLGAWPLKNNSGKNWLEFVRALPTDAPGQRAYQDFLKTWKNDNANAGKDDAHRDLAFLRVIAREYFCVLGTANKKFDPKHLIFGDRFAFQTAIPEVIEEMLPYVDGIAIQPRYNAGFPKANFARLHKLTGKPIIICDFAIRFKDGDKNIRGWKPAESAAVAGQQYAEYVSEAMATPYVIGAFWCNPIDSQPGFQKQGIKQGLFPDQGLTPRPELHQAIRELNQRLVKDTPKE